MKQGFYFNIFQPGFHWSAYFPAQKVISLPFEISIHANQLTLYR